MSAAEISDIIINKSTYFEVTFDVTNEDGTIPSLVGATSLAKIRKYPSSPTYTAFNTYINTSYSTITLSLTESMTATLTPGRNYFDILVIQAGKTIKIIKGTMIVEETVS